MMGDTIARQAISLVLTVWITRVLGPEGFGRLSFALSLYALFGIVTTLGLNRIAVREFASGIDSVSTNRLLTTALVMRIIASVIVAVIAVVCCAIIAPVVICIFQKFNASARLPFAIHSHREVAHFYDPQFSIRAPIDCDWTYDQRFGRR